MNEQEHYLLLIKDIYTNAKTYLCQRLSQINYNKKAFELKEKIKDNREPYFEVLYDSNIYMNIVPYCKNYKTTDGKLCARGHISIKCKNDSAWYNVKYKTILVFVNEHLGWETDNKEFTTEDFFDKFLPTSNKQTEENIKSDLASLNISIDKVYFDTMNQRYVLNIDLEKYLSLNKVQNEGSLYLCKYMSLDTFLWIIKTNKIRLNSVVSMNDSSESFFLGDYLCHAYDDVRRKNTDAEFYEKYPNALRYSKLIERKNTLIMSLTNLIDDAMMWRLYGDNGRGICMCFDVPQNLVVPISYISEKNQELNSLKKVVDNWRAKNINVIFCGLEEYMFVTKSTQFNYEKEFRLLKNCKEDKLHITKYGDLISYYADYDFKELGIKPSALYIGSNLPYRDVNYPLLVDMAKQMLGVTIVNNSSMDQLRVQN